MQIDYFDLDSCGVKLVENRLGQNCFVIGTKCNSCVRYGPLINGGASRIRTADLWIMIPSL
jgi:hypothetical protein